MSTINELNKQAEDLYNKRDFSNACVIYLKIWETEKTEAHAFNYARSLRKANDFKTARQFHEAIKIDFNSERIKQEFVCLELNELWWNSKTENNGRALLKFYRKTGECNNAYELYNNLNALFPNSGGLKLAKLWLDYSCKIKDWQNINLLTDAEELLAQTDKYNKYTGDIHNKTVLSVVKYLIYSGDNSKALDWLEKLDFSVLKNDPFVFNGIKYTSDQKAFFIQYSDVLIKLNKHIEYIENYLTCLNFEGLKHSEFKRKIIESFTFGDYLSRVVLALYLKFLKEEIHLRKRNDFQRIYNENKITLVSDLSGFEFCPASFAISETYSIPSNASWEKDEWLGEKKHLIHRYNDFAKNKDLKETFTDSSIEVNKNVENDFNYIFNSKIVINNFDSSSKTFFSNATDTIRGNPDYVFEDNNGKQFVVVEKFTKRTSEDIRTAFSNDLIKLYGYLFELTTLNLDFGYLIYWYWQYDDLPTDNGNVKKKIRIKTYRMFKIEKSNENKNKLEQTIRRIEAFKKTKQLLVDGNKISNANKCLHCSVVSYCNHKTGKYDMITLPYDTSELVLNFDNEILIKYHEYLELYVKNEEEWNKKVETEGGGLDWAGINESLLTFDEFKAKFPGGVASIMTSNGGIINRI